MGFGGYGRVVGRAVVVGVALFIVNVLITFRKPASAGDDPWGGATLEWATSSPPPEHNFDVVPVVRDRDPLWYNRDHNIPMPEKPAHLHIHMPPPSYFPLVLGIGILLIGAGALSSMAITALGIVVIVYALWGWALEPTD